MTKEAKATEYRIEPLVKLLRSEAISDGGTRKKAEALEGKFIRLNETMFVFEEAGKVTLIYSDRNEVGCACKAFSDPSMNVLCEHIIAAENLKEPPQLTIESPDCRWLREYLFGLGWYTKNGYLYPSLVSELQEDVPSKLDPVNEDHDLDIGVDDDVTTVHYECPKCGESIDTEEGKLNDWKLNHMDSCPGKKETPGVKKMTPEFPEIPNNQEHEPVVKDSLTTETPESTVAKNATVEKPQKEDEKVKQQSKKTGSLYDWVENLIEFGVGQIFGDTGTAKTAFCREVAEQAADEGKKVVYWDSEGNMTRAQRAAMNEHKNITYVLDRDWAHIKNMLSSDLSKGSPKLPKCDLFILDSIGVPVLGIYGTLKQNQKGNALQAMQGLLYELTKFAETNEAVVIVTNQPVSEMNKNEAERADRHPFGDKAMFFTKEILKIVPGERTEYKTVCHIMAWRSRSAGRGKMLCTVTVSDSGVQVTPTGGE